MNSFCPKCGSEQGPFIKGFCRGCYLENHTIIDASKELKIGLCKRCGKIRLKGKWIEENAVKLAEHILSKVKVLEIADPKTSVKIEEGEDGEKLALVSVSGKLDGEQISLEREIALKPKQVLCDDCYKLGSDYYEAILQLRLKEKPAAEEINAMLEEASKFLALLRKKDPLADAVKLVKQRNGFDAYIASRRAAKKTALAFAKKYDSRMITSFKEKGHDEKGRVRKRFTYSVKI